MSDDQGVDEEYREIELYLQQAQAEIGQALSNLSLNSQGLGQDENANNAVDFTNSSSLHDLTLAQRSTLQPAPTSAFEQVQPRGVQNVDFLAIFAQNNLVAGNTFGAVHICNDSGNEGWNRTLPIPQRTPAERPKTLTPPPKFPGHSRSNYKNRDWRLYVRGEYLFSPIRSEEESSCSTTEDRGDSSYMESTKESGASTSEFSAAELSAESSSASAENKDMTAAIQKRFEKVPESEDALPPSGNGVDGDNNTKLIIPNPVVPQTVNASSGQISEYDNLRSTEEEDCSERVLCNKQETNSRKINDCMSQGNTECATDMQGKEFSDGKCDNNQKCDSNSNSEVSNQNSVQGVEISDKIVSNPVDSARCDTRNVTDKGPKGSFRAPNPVSQTLDSHKDPDSSGQTSDSYNDLDSVYQTLSTRGISDSGNQMSDSNKQSNCVSQQINSYKPGDSGSQTLDSCKKSKSQILDSGKGSKSGSQILDFNKLSNSGNQASDPGKASDHGSKILDLKKASGTGRQSTASEKSSASRILNLKSHTNSHREHQISDSGKSSMNQVVDSDRAFNSLSAVKSSTPGKPYNTDQYVAQPTPKKKKVPTATLR